FQAEDGIRDFHVTGVQTCALPISPTKETPPANVSTTAGRPIDEPAGNCGWGRSAAIGTKDVAAEVGRPSVCAPWVHNEQGIQLRSEERRVGKACSGRRRQGADV